MDKVTKYKQREHLRRYRTGKITKVNKGIIKRRNYGGHPVMVYRGISNFEKTLAGLKNNKIEAHGKDNVVWVTPSKSIAEKYGDNLVTMEIDSDDLKKVPGRSKLFKVEKDIWPSQIKRIEPVRRNFGFIEHSIDYKKLLEADKEAKNTGVRLSPSEILKYTNIDQLYKDIDKYKLRVVPKRIKNPSIPTEILGGDNTTIIETQAPLPPGDTIKSISRLYRQPFPTTMISHKNFTKMLLRSGNIQGAYDIMPSPVKGDLNLIARNAPSVYESVSRLPPKNKEIRRIKKGIGSVSMRGLPSIDEKLKEYGLK